MKRGRGLFWLPDLTGLTGNLRDWDNPAGDQRPWLAPLNFRERDVVQLLDDIGPTLMALFLCGYLLNKVEIAIAGQERKLVIDIENRLVGSENDGANGQAGTVTARLFYTPIVLFSGSNRAIPLSSAEFSSAFPDPGSNLREELRGQGALRDAIVQCSKHFLPDPMTAVVRTVTIPGAAGIPDSANTLLVYLEAYVFVPLMWFASHVFLKELDRTISTKAGDGGAELGDMEIPGMGWIISPGSWWTDEVVGYPGSNFRLIAADLYHGLFIPDYPANPLFPRRPIADYFNDFYQGTDSRKSIDEYYAEQPSPDTGAFIVIAGPFFENQITGFSRVTPRRRYRMASLPALTDFFFGQTAGPDSGADSWDCQEGRLCAQEFLKSAQAGLEQLDPAMPPGEIGSLRHFVRKRPYIETILRFAELGLIQLDGIGAVTEIDEDIVPVELFQSDLGELIFTHALSDGKIYVILKSELGYTLQESFSWEYIPALNFSYDEPVARYAGQNNRTPNVPKLLIVAAPGVQITSTQWPHGLCEIIIYRVQDHSLLPPWGSPISTTQYDLKNIISPLDILESQREVGQVRHDDQYYEFWHIKADPEETEPEWNTQAFWENQFQLSVNTPIVVEEPFRQDGYVGVRISYPGRVSSFDFEEAKLRNFKSKSIQELRYEDWPGHVGRCTVEIAVPEGSGTDRYAYELIPWLDDGVIRNVGKGVQPYVVPHPIVRYALVIYRTEGVRVSASDEGINFKDLLQSFWPDKPVSPEEQPSPFSGIFDYVLRYWGTDPFPVQGVFDYFLYTAGIKNVPPHGNALSYSSDGAPVTVETIKGIPASISERIARAQPGSAVEWPSEEARLAELRSIASEMKTFADHRYVLEADLSLKDAILEQASEHAWAQLLLIDLVIGFSPIGDVADLIEFLISLRTGCDKWGRPVTKGEQSIMLSGVLPFVSGSALRALKETGQKLEGADNYMAYLDGN